MIDKIPAIVRVCIYIRVSTQEQAKEGYSIEAQRDRLIAYCKARGWTIVEIIVDPGYSGASLDRPGIQQLMDHVKDYDMVLIYKLDRLSRSQRDTLYIIEDIFKPNGVGLASLSESLDTSTPHGMAMIGILSSFAQLERATIAERTEMGRVERVKEGKYHGGSFPIGYDYDSETGKLVPNEYEAMQVRLIYQLYIGTAEQPGIGVRKIADYMQEHGYKTKYGDYAFHHTVTGILQSRNYLGEIRYKDIVVQNAHEPIITQEQFDRAQLIRKTREAKSKGGTRSKQLLTGFLWCGCCGARAVGIKRNAARPDIRHYVCYSQINGARYMRKTENCPVKSWLVSDLDAVVDYEIRSLIFDKEALQTLIKRDELMAPVVVNHDAAILKQIAALDKRIDRLMDLYADGELPVELLNERIRKLHEEKSALAETLSGDPAVEDEKLSAAEMRTYLDDIAPIWDKADVTQRREILSVLVDKVWIYEDNTVKIDWAFL